MSSITSSSTIYVAGHRGMAGSAIVRKLRADGFQNIIERNHSELDLKCQADVEKFFRTNHIDYVVLAAARVGGIHANNTYPADFIYDNLMMECNVIHGAFVAGVKGLLFLGSSCIYPRDAEQPMREEALLTGSLEPTNEPYAIAKIAGIKLCESYNRQFDTDYRSVMPTNLYGPNDNFHPENSHVLPALMRRLHEAKLAGQPVVKIWGSGNPRREFLHVDDMASASVHVMGLDAASYREETLPMRSHFNVGSGTDVTIRVLAETIARIVGYDGKLEYDTSKPDGSPRKLMDISRIRSLGWQPAIALEDGIAATYRWFLDEVNAKRIRG